MEMEFNFEDMLIDEFATSPYLPIMTSVKATQPNILGQQEQLGSYR